VTDIEPLALFWDQVTAVVSLVSLIDTIDGGYEAETTASHHMQLDAFV
jgi:hypothetical protein